MINDKLEAALAYAKLGLSIIPTGSNKVSLLKWDAFQNRCATIEEINAWWKQWPEANPALVTGKISGIVALDLDKKHGRTSKEFVIPLTASARSGNLGEHFFFKYPADISVKSGSAISGEGVDCRADGGYILLAPSVNEKGGVYEWLVPLESKDNLAEMPEWLKKITTGDNHEKKWLSAKDGVSEGSRNDTAASVAGKIIRSTAPELLESIGWEQLKVWNNKNTPPLHEAELRGVWESIKKYHADETPKESETEWSPTNRPRLWAIGEILTHDFGEEEWIVESLISKQGVTALSGNPGDFKTWITIHIALCVSRNLAVFDKFQATQGGVLIIDEEDHLRLLKKRLELLGAKETDNIHYLSQSGIKVDKEEVRDMILEIVKEKDIKLVILDSLIRIHQQEENDAGGMAKVFSSFQKIIAAGASILFTHHHRKQQGFGKNNPAQSMRGSSDILAAVDSHIIIEKKQDEDRLIIRQTKLRQDELLLPFEISILKGESGPSGFEYAGGHDEKKKKAEEAAEAVVEFLSEGMKNREEIHEALQEEFGKTAIDDGTKLGVENQQIERVPKAELPKEERKKAYYRLSSIHYSVTATKNGLPIYQQDMESEKQADIKDELPTSQLYIEAGNQEDVKTESYAK